MWVFFTVKDFIDTGKHKPILRVCKCTNREREHLKLVTYAVDVI